MKPSAFAVYSAWIALSLTLAVAATSLHPGSTGAQEPVSLAVDANPTGNTTTALGPTDQCVAVQSGDSFQIDVVVTDVVDLLGWDARVIYDASVLSLTDRDVKLFLGANSGSNVFDASDAPPDTDGDYRVAAADIADPPAPDSGSGVLARLTFDAVSPGVSLITLRGLDLSGDGRPDIGPVLTNVGGQRIGDSDGDAFFDGPTADAWIAVDGDCPQQPPPLPPLPTRTPVISTSVPTRTATVVPSITPTSTPPATGGASQDEDGPPWALIAGLGGGAAVLVLGALLLLRARRGA